MNARVSFNTGKVTLSEVCSRLRLPEVTAAAEFQEKPLFLSNGVLRTQDTQETKETSDIQEKDDHALSSEKDTVDTDINAEIDVAIASCKLDKSTARRDPLFDFARMVAGLEKCHNFSFSPSLLLNIFDRWKQSNEGLLAGEQTFELFLAKLTKVTQPYGCTLQSAYEKAKTKIAPLRVRSLTIDIQNLAKLCRELQSLTPSRPFFLGCREAGKILDVPFRTAADYLLALQRLGVIKLVLKGQKTTRQASMYRYIAPD